MFCIIILGAFPFGFDGQRKYGGQPAWKVYQNIRDGAFDDTHPAILAAPPSLLEALHGPHIPKTASWYLQRALLTP